MPAELSSALIFESGFPAEKWQWRASTKAGDMFDVLGMVKVVVRGCRCLRSTRSKNEYWQEVFHPIVWLQTGPFSRG